MVNSSSSLVYLSILGGMVSGFRLFPAKRASTCLWIDKRTADMIDQEMYRQTHRKEFENKWMEKNRNAIFKETQTFENDLEDQAKDLRQYKKDKTLAAKDPQAYCADRCLTTGNCDVYEDIFEFSPEEVMEFCSDCVLGDADQECDIPDAFWDLEDEIQKFDVP